MHDEDLSAADLATSEQFIQWVKHPTPQSDHYWEQWLLQHPGKLPVLEAARELVQAMHFQTPPFAAERAEAVWQQMNATLAERESVGRRPVVRPLGAERQGWQNWRKLAAALGGILLLGTILLLVVRRNAPVRYTTDYGQTRSITLPDGSRVMLNANSSLSVNRNWEASREVWLEGEAFFSVRKKPVASQDGRAALAKFVVRTANARVQVLGTEFNVFERQANTVVVLNSGTIQLALPADTIAMQPGELVELAAGQPKPVKRVVPNPAVYSAWKNGEWVLDSLSLKQVAVKLEETYGIPVLIERADAADLFATGVLPTGDLDILLQSLSQSLDVEVTRRNNQIIVR